MTGLLVAWLLSNSAVQTATPPSDVHVRLALRDGQTTFKSGEAIRLQLTFTADKPGYKVETSADTAAPQTDRISVTPDDGLFHWKDRLEPRPFPVDSVVVTDLSTSPATVEVPLNKTVRFDKPGDYRVRVTTRRVSPDGFGGLSRSTISLATNEVTFHVELMTDAEEEQRVLELRSLLARPTPFANRLQEQTEHCEDLAFLVGRAAAREKVEQYFHPEGHVEGNWIADLRRGFFISKDPAPILEALDARLRDLSQPVRWSWITDAARLRQWMETGFQPADGPDMFGGATGEYGRYRQAYLDELVASLSQRIGTSQVETAFTLLMVTAGARPWVMPPAVREVIVRNFDKLEPSEQRMIISSHWADVRDPALAPALHRLATNSVNNRPEILRALHDVDPAGARDAFIAEILNPHSLVRIDVLGLLSDPTLPEVDTRLLQATAGLARSTPIDQTRLSNKAQLLARFASEAIRDQVAALFKEVGPKVRTDVKVSLLAYLIKAGHPDAPLLVAGAVAEDARMGNLLRTNTRDVIPGGIEALLRGRLSSSDPQTVDSATRLLALLKIDP